MKLMHAINQEHEPDNFISDPVYNNTVADQRLECFFKQIIPTATESLLEITNSSLSSGYVPNYWNML